MNADGAMPSNRKFNKKAGTANWDYSEIEEELHRFFGLLNTEFFSQELPTVAISCYRGNATSTGSYRTFRDKSGLNEQIIINRRYLGQPKYLILLTLLHEMIHLWQYHFGNPGLSVYQVSSFRAVKYYHNKQFRMKAEELGIPCNSRGYSLSVSNPFIEFCGRHGIHVPKHDPSECFEPQIREADTGTKLRKYTCGCTNVWAAIRVQASCKLCGEEFKRQ
jgi:hypothetical protein